MRFLKNMAVACIVTFLIFALLGAFFVVDSRTAQNGFFQDRQYFDLSFDNGNSISLTFMGEDYTVELLKQEQLEDITNFCYIASPQIVKTAISYLQNISK